ncbi:MAG: flagellar biosynthesis anti-sigma factor FlgM [Sphingopyxis sp.]
MVDPVGNKASGPVRPVRSAATAATQGAAASTQASSAAPVQVVAPGDTSQGNAVNSLVAALVGQGAPIDMTKVQQVRNAIAQGQYPIDADKLAAKMIELDLPPQ